jgi:hypothetical protein
MSRLLAMSMRFGCEVPHLTLGAFLAGLATLLAAPVAGACEQAETRAERKTIVVHYMPWFEAKPISPQWGWHWTMNAFDPEKGRGNLRQIASHYHPLIGPYDSGDPHVLEYHMLLMRLAGIDGVIIDWYGRSEFLDYASNHRRTAALAEQVGRVHLQFAICYEDQTIPKLVAAGRLPAADRVKQARGEITWLAEHWFRMPAYLRLAGRPVLLSFGQDGLDADEWQRVLENRSEAPLYLSEHNRRPAAAGAFDWPLPAQGLKAQDEFEKRSTRWPFAVPVAYPRFHDFYAQARVHASYGQIDDDGGKVLDRTLERVLRGPSPLVQICTWNDWSEGTLIEPSVEFGYRDLEAVQRLRKRWIEPSFAPSAEDLRLPLVLYGLRERAPGDTAKQKELDRIARLLADRSLEEARGALGRAAP